MFYGPLCPCGTWSHESVSTLRHARQKRGLRTENGRTSFARMARGSLMTISLISSSLLYMAHFRIAWCWAWSIATFVARRGAVRTLRPLQWHGPGPAAHAARAVARCRPEGTAAAGRVQRSGCTRVPCKAHPASQASERVATRVACRALPDGETCPLLLSPGSLMPRLFLTKASRGGGQPPPPRVASGAARPHRSPYWGRASLRAGAVLPRGEGCEACARGRARPCAARPK